MGSESDIGRAVRDILTPALVVDPAGLQRNLQRLADYFADRPCKLRPHFKSHKCVTLARQQLEAGSITGITCAKLTEAEALKAGGVGDILIANQIIGAAKAQRLADMNRTATVRCCVDSAANVAELGVAAREAGVQIGVLVEVDIGRHRCGVDPGAPAVALAERVTDTDGLRLDGLQGYEGHVVTQPDFAERKRGAEEAMGKLVSTRDAMLEAGLTCAILSGGATGTYDITGNVPGMNEVQAGSYALMDWFYKKMRPEFDCCRTVLVTVVSARGSKAVVDVGSKGMGCEYGPPIVAGQPEAETVKVAEEHTEIENVDAGVGERLHLTPSHGCNTNNLHPDLWLVRDGVVEDVWPIEGRGCLQ